MHISRNDIHQIILEYLDLIKDGRESIEENLNALEIVLDKLALARHFVEYTFDGNDYSDSPRFDYSHLRELAAKQFPSLGYYNIPDTICEKVGETEIIIGDAIDDIADILGDLQELIWRWENNSPDDALFHFEITYDSHWGMHLRDLQHYLYHLRW